MTSSPLSPVDAAALEHWQPENLAYLRERAGNHPGLSPEQLLAEFPAEHRSEAFVAEVLPDLEISHIIPKDLRPDLIGDPNNIILELRHELGGRNQTRGAVVMKPDEMADVQRQTEVFLDARAAELQGHDPLLLGEHTQAVEVGMHQLDPDAFSESIAALSAEAGWQQGLSHIQEHVLGFLAEMGVPVAAVTARGAAALWPFLKSIDWKRFASDWRYTIKTLNRAMRAWREGGWKEACKALMLGLMVAHVPHLATVAAALGFTGLGALGVRWLASRRFMQGTAIGAALLTVADVLDQVTAFLKGVFRFVERVADVVIEAGTKVVKAISTTLSDGAAQVMAVCSQMAATAVKAAGQAVASAGRIASNLCSWVSSWFGGRRWAMA